MSTSIAFAHDLSPVYHIIFSFSNIPCGTCRILGDLYRFLSHLRMTCFNFTSCSSLVAVSYRSVHGIRVSTRRNVAARGLCAYRVFDPFRIAVHVESGSQLLEPRSVHCF